MSVFLALLWRAAAAVGGPVVNGVCVLALYEAPAGLPLQKIQIRWYFLENSPGRCCTFLK